MVVFKLNTFFFFLFPFSDSCLVCLGFLKGFTTPHIGHHSSFSLLSYTFSLLLAPHFALSRTLDSHWTLYCKNFFLPDGQLCPAALLLAVEGESWPSRMTALCKSLCSISCHWDLGHQCFLSVQLQWKKVLTYWYFLCYTLPIRCC